MGRHTICISFDDDEWQRLQRLAAESGFPSVRELARHAVRRYAELRSTAEHARNYLRSVADMIKHITEMMERIR